MSNREWSDDQAIGERALAREPLVLDETEERLIRAWRRSGMSLGRLLVYAADEHALGAAVSLPGIADKALARMAEIYARSRGNAPADGAKGGA